MSPSQGSLYGGTDLTITGEGFSTNTSLMSVFLGPHICDVTEATSNQLKCRIADTGITHYVSDTGRHPGELTLTTDPNLIHSLKKHVLQIFNTQNAKI